MASDEITHPDFQLIPDHGGRFNLYRQSHVGAVLVDSFPDHKSAAQYIAETFELRPQNPIFKRSNGSGKMYVYIQTTAHCFEVGFYTPTGRWQVESKHTEREPAANRVAFLNGRNAVHSTLDYALNSGDGVYRP